jgi:hypothetical protein
MLRSAVDEAELANLPVATMITDAEIHAMIDSLGDVGAALIDAKPDSLSQLYQRLRSWEASLAGGGVQPRTVAMWPSDCLCESCVLPSGIIMRPVGLCGMAEGSLSGS